MLLLLASCGREEVKEAKCDATTITQTKCENKIPYTCWQEADRTFTWLENAALTGECK